MAAPCIGVSGRPCVDESRSGTMGVQIVELGENKTNGYPCYQNANLARLAAEPITVPRRRSKMEVQ